MSEEQMNSYRLTSLEEPGDERVAAGIESAAIVARRRVAETINRLRDVRK